MNEPGPGPGTATAEAALQHLATSVSVGELPAASRKLQQEEARLVCISGREVNAHELEVVYLFQAPRRRVELRVLLRADEALPSIVGAFPAAEWLERELHEFLGVRLEGHPAPKPLLAHDGWPAGGAPLRPNARTAGTTDFPFRRVEGDGVYEVPVGPIHAGIIEPGHFRFSLAGERVLHLEVRLGYVHRGVEKLLQGKTPEQGLILAERTSGDNSAAHAVAYCQALEALAGTRVPDRAAFLRTIFLETERITNHLADVGGVILDVAYGAGWARCAVLREEMLRAQARIAGNRLLFGVHKPGGVAVDPGAAALRVLAETTRDVVQRFSEAVDESLAKASVLDRLEGTGRLTREDALALGVVGPAARASGVRVDARVDWAHAAYPRLSFATPILKEGDVLARVRVKQAEAVQSAGLIGQCVASLPRGPAAVPLGKLPAGTHGWGAAEAHRGEVVYGIVADAQGRIARCRIRDPSFMNWRAVERAVPLGNILADFPVVNKSFNLSYAGNDR